MLSAKKVMAGIAGTALLAGLLFGTSAVSYMRTAGRDVREAANDAIPEEFKLRTARNMLNDELEPQLRQMKHVVAEAQIEVERLTDKLNKRADQLAMLREGLAERHAQYQSGEATFTIGNVSYTREQIREDMEERYQQARLMENTLQSEREVLAAKKAALAENEKKITELIRARGELELKIQELEARVSAVEARETIAHSEFDESALNDIRGLLDSVEKKVDVREREMTLDGQSSHRIPTSAETPTTSLDEISAYLGQPTADSDVAVTE